MRRYIIIIGAMKSGTTTLFDVLAQHPEIAPASNKEPGFFAFEDIHAQGYDWFDGLFDFDPDQHRYRLEASTDYTKTPFVTGVLERTTAREEGEVKLIYIMRHPLRRLESHARHTERTRREVGQIISPRPSHSLEAGLSPVSLATSAYATQLKPYAAAREAGQLHCLTLEALKGAPEPTLVNLVLPKGARDRISNRFRKQVHIVEGRFKLTDAEEASLANLYASDLGDLRDSYGIETERLWKL